MALDADNEPLGSDKDFLVVGIGASAGGIKALQQFFSLMPADSGMAFVVILHLSPEHESNLDEIIQRQTKMRVRQVTETLKVEPDNVYVIPPAKHLELVDGVIKVREPRRVKGIRVPIDWFFRTLASAYGTHAVSIILSGTGSDGAQGMKHIKGFDGFAIVQDPNDAEYDGMPRSAIATKIVDVVLPVTEMPEKLLSLRVSSERLKLIRGDAAQVASEIKHIERLRDVLKLLRIRTGHDFSDYKRPTLIRRIARHLQIHETDDLEVYLGILHDKPDEVLSLIKNLLINVTNFFRDKEAFAALEKKVLPSLFEGRTGSDTIRVWIAGCASGEEAYSLAILLSEYAAKLPDPPRISIFASDVDDEAIAEAREGRFTEAIVSDVSPERLREYFIKDGSFYFVKKRLREMVMFAPHNLLRDPPFSRIDLISCRNVLIYLNRDTQARLLQIFHFGLNGSGYLFLGSSESADGGSGLYTPVDKKHRLYRARPSGERWQAPPEMPLRGKWPINRPTVLDRSTPELQSYSEIHRTLAERLAPASVLISGTDEILHSSDSAGQFLRFAGGQPTNNFLKVVHPVLLSDVRALMYTARRENRVARTNGVRLGIDGSAMGLDLEVRPVDLPEPALLVVFRESQDEAGDPAASVQALVSGDTAVEGVVRSLEEELKQTKDKLRNTIEQYEMSAEELKASNEELQAINEELRSAGEELETSKEELQSVNEELTTVNYELKEKIDQLSWANSDLQNLMQATEIGTIFLDTELRVKRFTPGATRIFNIIASDVGRPLAHLTHSLGQCDFTARAAEVLSSLQTTEQELNSTDGRYFLSRMSPYRSTDDQIDGVVLAFIDITDLRRAESELRAAQVRMRLIVESSTDFAIFTTGIDRIVDTWNPGAEKMFGYAEPEIIGVSGDILYVEPDRAAGVPVQELKKALETGRAENERWHLRKDGSIFYGSGLVMPLKDDAGNDMGVVKIMRDLTERKLAEGIAKENEAQIRGQKDAFQAAIDGAPLRDCLEILLRSVTESRVDGLRAAFYLVNEERQTLHPVASAGGLSESYLDRVDGFHVGPDSFACGLAVASGKPVLTVDVREEPRWKPLLRLAEEADFRGCWSFPIETRAGKFIGSYAMYHREPREATARDIELAGAATRAAAILVLRDNDAKLRRLAEEELRRNQERLMRMINMPGVGVLTFDREGRLIDANDAFLDTVGYTRDEIRTGTLTWRDFTPPEHIRVSEEVMDQLARVGKGGPYEKEYFRKDGSRVWMMFVSADLGDGTVGEYAIDISARKRGEEALRESEGRLRTLLENLPGGAAFIVDRDLRYVLATGEALTSLGFRSEDFVGKTLREAVDPELANEYEERFSAVLDGGDFMHEHDFMGRRFVTRGIPLSSNGRVYAALALSYDISERRAAEQQLQEQYAELARFNRAAVGREIRMIELKKEVNELLTRLAETPKYPLDFERSGERDDG